MGWTTDAPSLPSGSSYSSVGSFSTTSGNYSADGSIAIARLTTNQVSIRFKIHAGNGSGGNCYPPSYWDLSVSGSTKSHGWAAYESYTWYWTGTLNKGSTAAVKAGAHYDGSAYSHATYLSKTATGPAYVTKYAVTYDGNGAEDGSTDSQTKTYGTALTLRQNGFTKTGYAFVKWNTKADGTGTSYAEEASYTANAAVTLYAQWAPNEYEIGYNGNGADGGEVSPQEKIYGVPLTLRQNGFTKTGHHFLRWNTAADGSGTGYAEEAAYTANAAATLYAQWAPDTYAVTYDGNGAESGSVSAQTKTYNTPLVLAQNGYSRHGYAFDGWNTEADGTGTAYAAGAAYTGNEAVTLYAQWIRTNIPAYVNVKINGTNTICQVDKAYAKVDGTVVECDVYVNVGGTIIQIV